MLRSPFRLALEFSHLFGELPNRTINAGLAVHAVHGLRLTSLRPAIRLKAIAVATLDQHFLDAV